MVLGFRVRLQEMRNELVRLRAMRSDPLYMQKAEEVQVQLAHVEELAEEGRELQASGRYRQTFDWDQHLLRRRGAG